MKAIIITQPGEANVLHLLDQPMPVLGENEVRIKVFAAGINRPDIVQRKGKYAAPPGAPQDIPGLEVAGIIDACGAHVKSWKEGDAVCSLLAGGGYAEYAVAHEDHCLPKPTNLTFVEAASLPETVFTVWHNVFQRGLLKENENLLIHGGSSGIGTTAIQLASAIGARVYATAGTDEKCEACKQLGTIACINYKTQNFEAEINPMKMDVILDMVGGSYTEKNIRLLNDDGRLVFINAMKGPDASINIIDIMRRRLTITGSTLRNREVEFKASLSADVEKHVWPLIDEMKFKPIIYKVFPLAQAAKAHLLMESSEHIGKIVLEISDAR